MAKPVLLDGAVGTALWEKTPDKKPVWQYNLERPELVRELHQEYIQAGAKIILANTFGANGPMVSRSSYTTEAVVSAGVRLAREAAAGTDVKVALSAGPLSQLIEPYGDLTEAEAAAIYEEQLGAGMDVGADLILLQTFIDLSMMKIALQTARSFGVPVFCAMSFEAVGRTMMGNSVADVIRELTPLHPDALGLNCSLGPDKAVPIIRSFREQTDLPLLFKPNAGLPIGSGDDSNAAYDVEAFVTETVKVAPFVQYIGGCCGSNAGYIRRLAEVLNAM